MNTTDPRVAFNTSDTGRGKRGYPLRAQECRCGDRAIIHQHECVVCGRLPQTTIRRTWQTQAQRMSRLAAAHAPLPRITCTPARMPAHQIKIDLAHL